MTTSAPATTTRSAEYQDRQAAYERDRANYMKARDDYDRRYGRGAYDRRNPSYADRYRVAQYRDSAAYYAEQAEFERGRATYERARYDYDRRNGDGAYDRRHPVGGRRFRTEGVQHGQRAMTPAASSGSATAIATTARDDYDRRNGYGSYDRRYPGEAGRYSAPYAGGAYQHRHQRQRRDQQLPSGRQAQRHGRRRDRGPGRRGPGLERRRPQRRPEGTVLGALVGGGIGAAVGNASAKCDTRGNYYSYDQTQPYRYSDGRYADASERCRLAPAADRI
jgi:hypothetical protein